MHKTLLALVTTLALADSASGQQKVDMEKWQSMMSSDAPAAFQPVMERFIELARAKDVEGMLNITSAIKKQQTGLENLRQQYLEEVIPTLSACQVLAPVAQVLHLDAAQTRTGSGWLYKKACYHGDKESITLRFIVLNEEGNIALSSFGIVD
jgi:hypothetical protein